MHLLFISLNCHLRYVIFNSQVVIYSEIFIFNSLNVSKNTNAIAVQFREMTARCGIAKNQCSVDLLPLQNRGNEATCVQR